jgi:hypothetical protein
MLPIGIICGGIDALGDAGHDARAWCASALDREAPPKKSQQPRRNTCITADRISSSE